MSECRTIRVLSVAALSVPLAGCYTVEPVGAIAPVPGASVTFDVTDAGRSALGGSMGPEIVQIDGLLLEKDSTDYVIGVTGVRFVGGGEQTWRGERIRIKPEYVRSVYERQFSTARTAAFVTAGVGAVVYLVTRSIIGGGSVGDPCGDACGTGTTSRIPRP